MNADRLEERLRAARLSNVEMKRNHAAVKAALARSADKKPANGRRFLIKALSAAGPACALGLGIVLVLLSKEAKTQNAADDLGNVWCTYIDGGEDGNAVIWPPSSTQGRNNFVKSAPGYGGKGYAVRFKGKVDRRSRAEFMGVTAFLGPRCAGERCGGVNIQKYKKIRFNMKGKLKGGELVLLICNSENEQKNAGTKADCATAYEAKLTDFVFADWRTVTLDLRGDFTRPEKADSKSLPSIEEVLADAGQVKWHVRRGKEALTDVWIDNLEFY